VILHFVPWLFVVSAIEDRVSPQCLRLTLPIGTDPTRAAPQPWVEILWLPGPETAPDPSVAATEVFQPIGRTDGWGGRNVEVSATLTRRPADEKDAAA
jgi:hypothetical protein